MNKRKQLVTHKQQLKYSGHIEEVEMNGSLSLHLLLYTQVVVIHGKKNQNTDMFEYGILYLPPCVLYVLPFVLTSYPQNY